MSTLKVGAIQSATGNTSITLANDGTTTLASPPSISSPIILSAYSINNVSAASVIPYNQISIDTANAHDTSTSRYTVPRAGYYEVSFNYLLRNCTSGHRTNVRVNGTPANVGWSASAPEKALVWTYLSGEVNISASTIVQCAQSDILDVHLYYIANGDIYGAVNIHNQLTIKYLG
jgi:hypothetical protein